MEKINYITVNGVTYEIGGSDPSLPVFYLSENITTLETGASKGDIDTALGGSGDGSKIIEIFEAIKAGKLILLKNDSTGALGGIVNVFDNQSVCLLSFSYQKGIDNIIYFFQLSVMKIASQYTTQFRRVRLEGTQS